MADVLQGRVPGVTLQSAVGTTGGSQKIRIRGSNSLSLSNEPLLYVDGVLVSNGKGGISLGGQDYSRLNDINAEEIENIEILKGPAASAIYGSAAAVGVILISTRRGLAGAPQWRMYAEGGRMEDKNDYPLNYAALTEFTPGEPFYDIPEGGYLNVRSGLVFADPTRPYDICHNYQAAIPVGQTISGLTNCRQDVRLSFDQFRDARTTPYQTGARAKFGTSVSGGSEALTYFISGDRDEENGVLRPNNLQKISLRTNLNARIGSKLTAAVTAAYIKSDTERISNDNSVFSPMINALLGPAAYVPGMETDTAGSPQFRLASYFGYNTGDQRLVKAFQTVDRFIIGANTQFTPLSWLSLNGNAGLDYYGRFDHQTMDPNIIPLALDYIRGFRDAARGRNNQYTANGGATATFGLTSSLTSNTTIGASYQESLFETVDCYGIGIPAGTRSCQATTSQFAIDETYTNQKTVGIFGRQEFAFADRLFLSGSLRADNNSGLVREVTGLSIYPSVNASWLISRESFFPNPAFLSTLRLRAGWGQAGQRPGFGDAETFFAPRVIQLAGAEVPALILTRTGNPTLKVERTTEFEGGFDIGLFDDRFSAEFTGFTRKSKDALISRDLPPSAGLTASVFQNLGSVKNSGMEFGLNANVLNSDRVRLDARLSATTLHNTIEDLGVGIAPIPFYRGRQQHREGFPAGAYYAHPYKYNDADGNGLLSRAEVTPDTSKFLIVPTLNPTASRTLDTLSVAYVGPSTPTNTQGFSLDLTVFKNFTISTLFERRGGHKQLNETEYFRCRSQHAFPGIGLCSALANPEASLEEQARYIASQFLSATPYGYMEDGTFTKWRELSVRFGFPESWGNQFRALGGAAITLSGRNLKTWTNYTGIDPEISETGGTGGAATGGFSQGEFNTQPPVRVFSLRFDVKL
jgi:TonB-linked SusC/RagA family outer membrane protein